MCNLTKNIGIFLITMLVVSSCANLVSASSHPTPGPLPLTEQEKVFQGKILDFLTNIFSLNMTDYKTEDVITSPSPNGVFVTVKFRQTESSLDVGTEFRDGELIWCMLYPVKGAPIFTKSESLDALNAAKDTLDRLQAFSTKEYLSPMQNMLNPITELQNSKTSSSDFTQEITVKENDLTISWVPFANGLSNQQNQLTLEFKDGNLMFYADYLGTYTIGSSDAKISEEQAIEIAIEQARAFTWVQGNETVSNVNVIEEPFFTKLSLQNRGNATLYPLWEIKIGLDKMYPGGVTSFQVFIWADTGEVASVRPIGAGGVPQIMPTESPTVIPINNQAGSDYTLAIVIALVVTTLVIGSLIVFKRRK